MSTALEAGRREAAREEARGLFIGPESHLDHGLSKAHCEWLLARFADRTGFFIESVQLPSHLPALSCALFGPVMGDGPIAEHLVTYRVREGRQCASRIYRAKVRSTRIVTVIAGPRTAVPMLDGKLHDVPCYLYTAYGGPAAPREPGDSTITTLDQLCEARAFWREHALASGVTNGRKRKS